MFEPTLETFENLYRQLRAFEDAHVLSGMCDSDARDEYAELVDFVKDAGEELSRILQRMERLGNRGVRSSMVRVLTMTQELAIAALAVRDHQPAPAWRISEAGSFELDSISV